MTTREVILLLTPIQSFYCNPATGSCLFEHVEKRMNPGAASALAFIIFPVSSYHNSLQHVPKIVTLTIALNSHFSSISKPLDQFCSKEEHINSNLYIPPRMLPSLTVFLIFAEPKKTTTSADVNTRVFYFRYGQDWLGVPQRFKTPFNKTIDFF